MFDEGVSELLSIVSTLGMKYVPVERKQEWQYSAVRHQPGEDDPDEQADEVSAERAPIYHAPCQRTRHWRHARRQEVYVDRGACAVNTLVYSIPISRQSWVEEFRDNGQRGFL